MADPVKPDDEEHISSAGPVSDAAAEETEPAILSTADEAAAPVQIEESSAEAEAEGEHGESFGNFAESVVSGLEQLEIEENEALDLAGGPDSIDVQNTDEDYFSGWDGLDVPEADEIPIQAMPATSRRSGPELDSLRSLSEIGFASAAMLSGHADTPALEVDKHDELADAVQAALLSVYGQPAVSESAASQPLAFPEEALPSHAWSEASRESLARSNEDGLSPQDVILNYFDYSSGGRNGVSHAPYGATQGEQDLGLAFRSRADVPSWQSERSSDTARRNQTPPSVRQAYDGPPSFPVPAAAIPGVRAMGSPERESSRLLGAAAIGLVGGIAIAASLAAFLIYGGPHQTTIDIPGIGNLRLDKDEQGYGRGATDEGVSEAPKTSIAKASVDYTSEVLAGDVETVAGQPASLAISIRSQLPFERTLVSITGVPEGGRLNAGVDAGGGSWLLPPRRLNGLTVNLPDNISEPVALEVQLLDSNARTPLSAKSQFFVKPAVAPSPAIAQNTIPRATATTQPAKPVQAAPPVYALNAAPAPQTLAQPPQFQAAQGSGQDASFKTQTVTAAPPASAAPFQAALVPGVAAPAPDNVSRRGMPRPEVEDLIREGNKRMREGDILEARQFYQRAVAFGDPEAALAMGRSYDPIYFARIDKKNAEPDAAKAFDWYRRAMDAGAAQTAMVRIENLKHFLNE